MPLLRDGPEGVAARIAAARMMEVIIVDDEPAARRAVRECCEREPDLKMVGEYGDARAALEAIRQQPPQVLFLDIQMDSHDRHGAGALARSATLPLIVFVTAYDHYALEAFEVSAVDYLLKPFDDERFQADRGARAAPRSRRPGGFDRHGALATLLEQLENRGACARDGFRRACWPSPAAACTCWTSSQVEVVEADRNYVTLIIGRDVLPRPQHPAAGGEVLSAAADAAHQPLLPGQHESREGDQPHAARGFHPGAGRRHHRDQQRRLPRAGAPVLRAPEARARLKRRVKSARANSRRDAQLTAAVAPHRLLRRSRS